MKSKSDKIALVISSLKPGGMERVMVELAEYFGAIENLEVSLIVFTKGNIFYRIPESIRVYTPEFEIASTNRLAALLKTFFFLRKTLKKIKPNALLSFGGKYNSFVLLASAYLGINRFISDRSRPGISYGKFLDIINPYLYKKSSGIITQTALAQEVALLTTSHTNIKTIPNPVRIPDISQTQREKIILNVGRFVQTKRQIDLVHIFSNILIGHEDWQLVFIGDGPELENVKNEVTYLGIKESVTFVGNVSHVDEYYKRSSIFAFTSISEGFPNALLEGLAYGLACISFDCSAGPADLIANNDNGLLVNEGDIREFEEKLRELINNTEKRLNLQMKGHSSAKKYSIEIIGRSFLNFMLEIDSNENNY
jgi:GalNAc-alpha-(1->4)-GalNAc-alpha-(1->3)-diNAcBac-PP-undecaprenol alpha-1,4-N-acetyl-D-galactosaminyltransferase